MKPPRTICMKCRHLVRFGERNVWYNLRCRTIERAQGINPVTGERGYITGREGGIVMTEPHDRYEACDRINRDGDCERYEEIGFIRRLVRQ